MEGPTEEAEAFNPRESAINGSRNTLSGTRTATFRRRKAARRTEPWYLASQPAPPSQLRVPAKRKRSTGEFGLQLPWYLTSSPPPQYEDEDIPALKKPRLDPIIKNEAAVTNEVFDLCSDSVDEKPKSKEQDSSSMHIDAIADAISSLLGKECTSTPIANTCTSTLNKRDWVEIALKLKQKEVSSSMNIDAIVDAITSLLEKERASTPTIAAAEAETATKTASPEVAMALPLPHLADVHDDKDNDSATDTQLNPRAAEVVGRWTRAEDAELASAVVNTKKNKWGKRDWVEIATLVRGRAKNQCRNRWQNTLKPSIDKATGHSGLWAKEEDLKLRHALQMHGGKEGKDWFAIASLVSGQTKNQCTSRRDIASNHIIDPMTGHSKIWTEDEDIKLKDSVQMHGGKGWNAIAALVAGRTQKQCYNRWRSVLDHSIDRATARSGKWTDEEDGKLKKSIESHGGKDWGAIAALVPGRTITQCRNRWNNALNQSKKSVFELMMA